MIRLKQAIVVEGRYDKNALAQLVDAPVFTTDGFGILNNRQKLEFLRQVAQRRGLIILTDSDGAGFVIRNYLKGALPADRVFHAYIPDLYGKEKRKRHPGKEGKLGVEGMSPDILLQALRSAGAQIEEDSPEASPPHTAELSRERISFTDLYEAGLSGTPESKQRRAAFMQQLSLPEHLGKQGFLDALNILLSREEFWSLVSAL